MTESAPLQGRAFLVVDDETFVRGLVVRLLRGMGAWVVEEAADGGAAVALLKSSEYQFDCVLTDFAMRPRNGLRLLADIRTGAEGLKRNTPVLMLTAHSDAGLVWAAFQLDTSGFLVKPPTRASLAERLEKILSRPLPVKSADAYRQIAAVVAQAETVETPPTTAPNTVNAGTLLAQDTARPAAATAEPAASGPEFQVALDKVREGAVLSRNLLATGGGLLLANGTQLTGRLIERLRDLAEVDAAVATVWVHPTTD
ncbi:MAG: response regulator [Rhodospirillales bacterium]|nr:response regulator [Rhodospirillales bacterium]